MRSVNFANSSCYHCRHCRNYQMTSRRDGNCQQLGVNVQGKWKSCPLFTSTFTPNWEVTAEGKMHTVLI